MNAMGKQHTLLSWRKKLGLTQQALADYLGVSRSLVNLVERGERELPNGAWLEFSQLIIHYEAAVATIQLPLKRTQEARQKSLEMRQQRVKEITWQLKKSTKELTAMEEAYAYSLYQVQAFQTRRQQVVANPEQPGQEKYLLWLDIQEAEALKKQVNTHPDAQSLLQGKIAALNASLQEFQRQITAIQFEDKNGE